MPSISVQGVPESPLQTVQNVGVNDGVSRVLIVELVQRSASGSTQKDTLSVFQGLYARFLQVATALASRNFMDS